MDDDAIIESVKFLCAQLHLIGDEASVTHAQFDGSIYHFFFFFFDE